MKNKPKKYFKKGSMFTLVVLLFCLIFTSCDKDDDLSVTEPETSVAAKSLYFYGSDAEFKELEYPEMKRITTEKQLVNISKNKGNSYILFVGKDINIREGQIENLRNSGILVTQIEGRLDESNSSVVLTNTPDFQEAIKRPEMKNIERIENLDSEGMEQISVKDEIYMVTYLSVNGEKYMLGSFAKSFKNVKDVVPNISKWGEKSVEKSKKIVEGKSSTNLTRLKTLNIAFSYTTSAEVADFGILTTIDRAETPGQRITTSIGENEYPYMFIYNHKLIVAPAPRGKWTVTWVNLSQQPLGIAGKYKYLLQKYSPINTSNGVLDGSSGSDSFSAGFSLGLSPTANYDFTSSVDWSYPACRIYTNHNPVEKRYDVSYSIAKNGTWKRRTVTTEGYTYYSFMDQFYVNARSSYYIRCSPLDGTGAWIKDAIITFDIDGKIRVYRYPRGFHEYPNTTWPSFTFNW